MAWFRLSTDTVFHLSPQISVSGLREYIGAPQRRVTESKTYLNLGTDSCSGDSGPCHLFTKIHLEEQWRCFGASLGHCDRCGWVAADGFLCSPSSFSPGAGHAICPTFTNLLSDRSEDIVLFSLKSSTLVMSSGQGCQALEPGGP